MSSETIAFDKEQQLAILGHALQSPELWERLDVIDVKGEWFLDPIAGRGYKKVTEFRAEKGRAPTYQELLSYIGHLDAANKQATKEVLDLARKAAAGHRLDVLMSKLHTWGKARLMKERAQKINQIYNDNKHEEAAALWAETSREIANIDFLAGQVDRFDTSANRISNEERERYEEAAKVLPYGISFLDDALGGIFPKDLIMLGARSGAGKTDLAKSIARHNAQNGKHVHAFFLEAEDKEIERRIKYQMLADRYYEAYPVGQRPPGLKRINYRSWRMGELRDELDVPFNKEVEEDFHEKLKTLHTYYRVKCGFGIKDMEREILKIHEEADLIILDHLHYVDLEGDDENREMTKLVSKLNDISLGRGKPIIVVAHINKAGGHTLVPGMNDFHGSSNITKVARTGIMLAPASGSVVSADPATRGTPTFMRIVKCRLDGAVLFNTAVSFFSTENNTYSENYAIGHLNFPGTQWIPEDTAPYWAKRGTITDVSKGE